MPNPLMGGVIHQMREKGQVLSRKTASGEQRMRMMAALSTFGLSRLAYSFTAMQQSHHEPDYAHYAATIAPAALGCALGLLFGRGMERRSSNIAALALLATGAVMAGPAVVQLVQAVANRPASARGIRRRLAGIRDSGLPDKDVEGFFMDDIGLPTGR